jgi:sensor domain DACNV-containing protein
MREADRPFPKSRPTPQNTPTLLPGLIATVRDHIDSSRHACLEGVSDAVLSELITVVFFSGLETYEAKHYSVRVVFTGTRPLDVLLPEPPRLSAAPNYCWKALNFDAPRAFSISELTKLAVAGGEDHLYTKVQLLSDGLAVTGLARKGMNVTDEPFIELIVPRPGTLSIRSGRLGILEYERGYILESSDNLLFAAGTVREGLEGIARTAEIEDEGLPDYLELVRGLLRAMAAHGHGGILIISADEKPDLPEDAPYRLVPDSSLATLLRLSRLLGRSDGRKRPASADAGGEPSTIDTQQLVHDAFLVEIERVTEELGALTAIDGATIVNSHLALMGFGITLPVNHGGHVVEALDSNAGGIAPFDLGSRGTRHRAAATYANQHSGSVVFVASKDGPITCMFRPVHHEAVLAWRQG